LYRFLFLFLFCSDILNAQVKWTQGKTHDFGEIPEAIPVEHVFYYQNQGNTPLTIETTRTTCGCTAARYSETSIQPGETGSLTVTFDGQVPIGNHFKKKIKVFFRERKKGETLVVYGEVK
jgi:Protein of unknown function (DUF1573)